jgi:hypothetical protein
LNDADGTIGIPKDAASDEAAYKLARHWLEAAGFDVAAMEKEQPAWVEHGDLPLRNSNETSGRFAVRWGRKGAVTGTNCAATVKLSLRGEWLVSIYVTHLRYLRTPLPEVPRGEDINRLPDTPVRDFLGLGPGRPINVALGQPGFSFTNTFRLLNTPDPYREQLALAMQRTVSELDSRLHSECLLDNIKTNLNEVYVNPPAFGSGGRIGSNDVEVRFDAAGRLSYFSCLPAAYTNWRQWEATVTSLISSNQAFAAATQAVAALSIDMVRLDRDCERVFSRGGGMRRDTKGKIVQNLTPRFWLWWANTSAGRRRPVVVIGVCGDTGKVGMIELKDTTYYQGPSLPVSSAKTSNGP